MVADQSLAVWVVVATVPAADGADHQIWSQRFYTADAAKLAYEFLKGRGCAVRLFEDGL